MDIKELKEQIEGIRNAMSREKSGSNTHKTTNLQVWEDRIADIETEIKLKEKEALNQATI